MSTIPQKKKKKKKTFSYLFMYIFFFKNKMFSIFSFRAPIVERLTVAQSDRLSLLFFLLSLSPCTHAIDSLREPENDSPRSHRLSSQTTWTYTTATRCFMPVARATAQLNIYSLKYLISYYVIYVSSQTLRQVKETRFQVEYFCWVSFSSSHFLGLFKFDAISRADTKFLKSSKKLDVFDVFCSSSL